MKIMRMFWLAAVLFLSGMPASSEDKPVPTREIVRPAEEMVYKEVTTGVQQAVLWGDPEKAAYGALTRFAAGLKSPLHHHTSDMRIVVISGIFLYGTESSQSRLGPGSAVIIPAGRKHTSGGDAETGCLVFEESSGKFEIFPPMPTPEPEAAAPDKKKKK